MKFRTAGFTMIEILVVIFIVAILAGVTVASLPQFARTGDIDTEARRIKLLLQMARDESLLQSVEIGFEPGPDRYRFLAFDEVERRWSEIEDRPFQARKLEEGLSLTLAVEETDIRLGGAGSETGNEKVPPVLLLSSGETTPFELTLTLKPGDMKRTLEADGISEFRWVDDE